MTEINLEVVIILLLILTNGVFALGEMALVSARQARLRQQAELGDRGAKVALELTQEPNRFLSTVQVGITLIGILSGAFGGATLAEEIGKSLAGIEALAPYSEAIGIVIVVVGITFLSLVFGELVPKRLALNNAERFAAQLAPTMSVLSRIARPVVQLLGASTDLVLRLLRVRPSGEPPVTEEEVRMMIYEGTRWGIFEAVEQEMVERVLRLGDRKVSTMMTYRTEVAWLDVDDTLDENLAKIARSGHSRYPVRQGSDETVLGVVEVKDILAANQSGQTVQFEELVRPSLFIPETMTALKALGKFKEHKTHLALAVDEYGGVTGVLTLRDVLEAIVGDIPTVEQGEPSVIRREDGSLLLDGLLSVDELRDILELKRFPQDVDSAYETLGGLVMAQLGRIPGTGDFFEWEDLRFEVVDMDGFRVDKVLVTPQGISRDKSLGRV